MYSSSAGKPPESHSGNCEKVKYFGVKSFSLLSFWSMHLGSFLFTTVVGNSQSHFEIAAVDSAEDDRGGGFDWLYHSKRQPWHHHISLILKVSLSSRKHYDGKFPKIQVQPSSINTWCWQSFRSFYFSRASRLSRATHATPASPWFEITRQTFYFG